MKTPLLPLLCLAPLVLMGCTGAGPSTPTVVSDPASNRVEQGSATTQDSDASITICHIPQGNPENAHDITIDRSALPAHLEHGDLLFPCPQ